MFEKIPAELKAAPNWVCWRLLPDAERGKPRKVPYDPRSGKTAASNDPATWCDFDTAAALQIEFQPLIRALFSQVNPIPIKAAMKMIGFDCGPCRLPLTPISPENYENLKKLLSAG